MRTVLIIDDHPAVGDALSVLLSLRDIRPLVASSPDEGLALLEREPVDVVIQDMNFSADTTSGEEGVALFRALRARRPDLPVILLTAWTRLEAAVELVKAGAADYLAKPWDDTRLLATVENLLELAEAGTELRRLHRERRLRRDALARRFTLGDGVFESDAMLHALALACQVARADVPVLVTGPNGSGKERIAGIVHRNSAVRSGPFVAVNCGALPADLVEAELFGAESGAYTGAHRAREGRFDAADGGTLFLDEIGNLPLSGQVKLLRVLDTGRFERLGSSQTRQVKVRVISATNADLAAMVREGTFREDLYYRLNVIEVRVPPLAERPDDILPLAEHFLGDRATLGDAAREALLAHAWPGNVRELKNVVARAALLAGDEPVTVAQLGLPAAAGGSSAATGGSAGAGPGAAFTSAAALRNLDEPSRAAIQSALAAAHGVVSRAAQALGMSRQALYRRLEHHGLENGVRPPA